MIEDPFKQCSHLICWVNSGWVQIKPSLRVPPTIYLGMYLATATPYTSAHSRRSTDNLQRIEPGLCLYRAEQL